MVTQMTPDFDLYPESGLPDNVDEIYGFTENKESSATCTQGFLHERESMIKNFNAKANDCEIHKMRELRPGTYKVKSLER